MKNCLKERAVFRQRKTSVERFHSLTSGRSTPSFRRCRGFPSRSMLEIARNERKGLKCRLDFTAGDFSLVTSSYSDGRISKERIGDAVGPVARRVLREGTARPRLSGNGGPG